MSQQLTQLESLEKQLGLLQQEVDARVVALLDQIHQIKVALPTATPTPTITAVVSVEPTTPVRKSERIPLPKAEGFRRPPPIKYRMVKKNSQQRATIEEEDSNITYKRKNDLVPTLQML
jgi:hypothetical protein